MTVPDATTGMHRRGVPFGRAGVGRPELVGMVAGVLAALGGVLAGRPPVEIVVVATLLGTVAAVSLSVNIPEFGVLAALDRRSISIPISQPTPSDWISTGLGSDLIGRLGTDRVSIELSSVRFHPPC